MEEILSEKELLGIALSILGTKQFPSFSPQEQKITAKVRPCPDKNLVKRIITSIKDGKDPLGDAFCKLRNSDIRRPKGQIFTPSAIVDAMISRAGADAQLSGNFNLIIDPGAGTGRFLLKAGKKFLSASLIGIESDPVCAVLLRANLRALNLTNRATVLVKDYREIKALPRPGRALFIGNPPYVRHHNITKHWKEWYVNKVESLGYSNASKLAGLHLHFFIQTGCLSLPGDLAIFITAAEWMETNYGKALRDLLCNSLGGTSINEIDASSEPFPNVMTTAAITIFKPGSMTEKIHFQKIKNLNNIDLFNGHEMPIKSLVLFSRWSGDAPAVFTSKNRKGTRVGDVFRVSRGQVTGCNSVWIAGEKAVHLPSRFLKPCVTSAKEIFDAMEAGGRLINAANLKLLVDLPLSFEGLDSLELAHVEKFLKWAKNMGADKTYIAKHRNPWWSIRLHSPAPIICTYMARRSPAFIRNDTGAQLLNIAHGLYPKINLLEEDLDELSFLLNQTVRLSDGRVYAGGLIKFEPKSIEEIFIDWEPKKKTEDMVLAR